MKCLVGYKNDVSTLPQGTLDGATSDGAEVKLGRAEGNPGPALGDVLSVAHPGSRDGSVVTAREIGFKSRGWLPFFWRGDI